MYTRLLFILLLGATWMCSCQTEQSPVNTLADRVTEGTSKDRILFRMIADENNPLKDYFEISSEDGKVLITGNSDLSLATGLNWYLKYVAGIHLSWNNLSQKLPEILPLPQEKIRKETSMQNRYYLNYCTYSYSMVFWDWERWEKEIDWMAMHGINMPLSITGMEVVWYNLLKRLGYTTEEVNEFISGPAFMAWWQMNNLEGWGGPNPDSWYQQQEALQKKIVARMRELGIEPVFPGYAGMVPRNIGEKLGYQIADPGKWCGFPRPAFLSTEDEHFDSFAAMYYDACAHTNGKMLHGVGATPEGIENNPVMFELLYELPWREERFSSDEWLQTYLKARYGREVSPEIMEAWRALEYTVYNAPKDYQGEGTIESLLCARPGFHLDRTSTWGYSKLFYAPDSTAKAARLFTSVADQYKGNNNFEYDLVDIVRQSNADKGNVLLEEISQSYDRKDKEDFRKQTQQFLDLILAQDRLLSTRKEFSVSSWLNAARSLGTTEEEKRLYEWNASALITVWGDSIAANQGGLHDYSHREWSGLLKDLYYQCWKAFFEQKQAELDGKPAGQEINFYGMEKAWAEKSKAQTLKN